LDSIQMILQLVVRRWSKLPGCAGRIRISDGMEGGHRKEIEGRRRVHKLIEFNGP